MGASETTPSICLPGYILPAIKALTSLKKQVSNIGLSTLRIFKANYAGSYANDFDIYKAKAVSELSIKFLSDFVRIFYPEISDNLIFEVDLPFESTPWFALIKIAYQIETESELDAEVRRIQLMGWRHGKMKGMNKSIFYATLHPFYNQSIASKTMPTSLTEFIKKNPHPKLIIDFGGKPQRRFNNVIDKLRLILSPNEFSIRP